ncbi:Gfo/Idh/MocA family protein [Roseovarius sp. E0-M6]|uniref:Gfo/Idh/MocA family protein n=1 Tax=Roseovarius sp. E0-M6 TaxID=3127118 RepID=UPI00300F9AF9
MNTIKVAQIGCGYWGKNLARNFAELGALAAVVDGNPDTANAFSEQYSVPVRTLDEVLADNTIQAVSLATPAETHAALASRAIKAGKHVYVEKPLSLEIADAEAVIKEAASAERVLMVGHLLQYHPVFLRLREIVESGTLGPLRYIYSNRMSLGKFRVEENVLWSFAPHDFSMILSLAGEEPSTVTAQGAAFVTADLADWATVQFVFPSGVRGHVQASWLHPFKEHRLVVVGEKAMAVFEDSASEWGEKLKIYDHTIDYSGAVPVPRKADAQCIAVAPGEPLKEECRHFLDCAENGRSPRTDGTEGLRVLRALEQAESALQTSLRA